MFRTPDPDLQDQQVIGEIHEMRSSLATYLRVPRRWTGGLRRTAAARAIQGSNTIEGYTISDEDAAAVVDDEPPLSADEATWAEIVGYRRVLTYVLQVATTPGHEIDETAVRSMHFMLLEHDLSQAPGRYRTGPVFVRNQLTEQNVYEGPQAGAVPELMAALAEQLSRPDDEDPLRRGAMAHLNLVMIHPFRDGNGRMARALQTMVLARDELLEPTFSSIEEWLGANAQAYYDVLAAVGQGSWHPENDAALWEKFCLRAHHQQAQTLRRRFAEAESLWAALDELVERHGLPPRTAEVLFDALLGVRVTRPLYLKRTNLEERTATRDLVRLAEGGILRARGERRGRYYVAGPELAELRAGVRSRRTPLVDPYPTLLREVERARGDAG